MEKVLTFLFCIAGSDYTPFDQLRLTFGPGETRVCEPFMVREDEDLEGAETVSVFLTSRVLTVGERGMLIINILDISNTTKFFASCINTTVYVILQHRHV